MDPAETAALAEIRGYAAANRIRYTKHAETRMGQRNVRAVDVRVALTNASDCRAYMGDGGGWRVTGKDYDRDDLTVGVVLDDGVLVVTVF